MTNDYFDELSFVSNEMDELLINAIESSNEVIKLI